MENPAKHLVYRPTTMQLLSILTTTVEVMPKVCLGASQHTMPSTCADHPHSMACTVQTCCCMQSAMLHIQLHLCVPISWHADFSCVYAVC